MRLVPVAELGIDVRWYLWTLLLEREPHTVISHKITTFEEHLAFFKSQPYRLWFVIEDDAQNWVGQLSVTKRNEIGIQIAKVHRRRGYARAALELLLHAHKPLDAVPGEVPGNYIANIAPSNEASIALFHGFDAKLIQYTFEIPRGTHA